MCQYRAPVPCPRGYRYYADVSLTEHGMSSCIKVFPADTHDNAVATCGSLHGATPADQSLSYKHVARFHNLNASATPLVNFVATLAAVQGLSGQQMWTDATLASGVLFWSNTFNTLVAFDSVVYTAFPLMDR